MTFKRKFYALLFFKQCDRILKMFNQKIDPHLLEAVTFQAKNFDPNDEYWFRSNRK